MALKAKQISPLCKITATDTEIFECIPQYDRKTVLRGERVSYQIAIKCSYRAFAHIWCESDFGETLKLYCEKDVIVDKPSREKIEDENFLLTEPGYLPDVLIPMAEKNNNIFLTTSNTMIWVRLDIPTDAAVGEHNIKICFGVQKLNDYMNENYVETASAEFTIDIIDAILPEQSLIYTRWIHLDCIANYHGVEIFSEAHWSLIEKYIATAVDLGINMILVPVHTPPLDTAIGSRRSCIQLVDIEKIGDKYKFNFDKLRRYISVCKRCGVKYYEITHMFSQWGAECTPNIVVTENGQSDYMFGWHVKSNSEEYIEFLKQYIAAIFGELDAEGISKNTYFHISDEPSMANIDRYKTAHDIFKPLIGNSKILDALSKIEFYEQGLVECIATRVDHISEFLSHEIEDQWVYYCNIPERVYTNSYIAMPSARVRILGFLCYKYNIKGFLHWALNFYNSSLSRYPINPYLTTSTDGNSQSGDAFIVYPASNGVYSSIRGEVTYQAIQDIRLCKALEARIGKDAVVKLIDSTAGLNITFENYPSNNEFFEELSLKMTELLR